MEITLHSTDLFSVAQAAQEIGRSRLTVYRWVAANRVISVKLGGLIYIPRSEVERLKK